MESKLYSIGHGHKSIETFLEELLSFGICFLVDVRSSPYSKWAPQFNMDVLSSFLNNCKIRYVYWGDTMGGRPQSSAYYDDKGFFDYEKMSKAEDFNIGISRLVNANENGFPVAVMCSEADPSQCHRSKLIGRELYVRNGIDMKHIIAPNKFILESEIIRTLTKGSWTPEPNLFGFTPPPYFKSRKSYYEQTAELSEYYD